MAMDFVVSTSDNRLFYTAFLRIQERMGAFGEVWIVRDDVHLYLSALTEFSASRSLGRAQIFTFLERLEPYLIGIVKCSKDEGH